MVKGETARSCGDLVSKRATIFHQLKGVIPCKSGEGSSEVLEPTFGTCPFLCAKIWVPAGSFGAL